MNQPDWERTKEYILARLSKELAPDLTYHGVHHTRDDVLPAAERSAAESELDEEERLLLCTAALYHDTGYLEQYFRNELIAVRVAQETLPGFGYSPEQIESIGEIIMATRMPQAPDSCLQELMCDADLDSLGREDFLLTSHNLRQELMSHGIEMILSDWYKEQLEFLQTHSYFTPAAQSLRNDGKEDNIQRLEQCLEARSSRPLPTCST